MEKALNEMREDIGKKDEYQTTLANLKSRWEKLTPETEGLESMYEDLNFYHNDSQASGEKIMNLTSLLKKKVEKFKQRIEHGKR